MRAEDRKTLRKALPFAYLWPALDALVTRDSHIRIFRKGEAVWSRGDPPNKVFVILSGRIALIEYASDSTETLVDIYRTGDFLAGGAFIPPLRPYQFSSRVVEEARVWVIPGATFRRQLLRDPLLGRAMAQSIARIWYRLAYHIIDFKKHSANQRLGKYLLSLVDSYKGKAQVRLADDQVLIAGVLGVTRESLSRSFAQLREFGVSKRGRNVTIADAAKLRRFCDRGR